MDLAGSSGHVLVQFFHEFGAAELLVRHDKVSTHWGIPTPETVP